jgi:dimethylaniline monooxygenase (N-oxide forming)
MLAAGLDAIILEKANTFGGVFRKGNNAVYDDLYLTTTNRFMAFSDFMPLDKTIKYSSKTAYSEYLEAYVNHFNLSAHIQYNVSVDQVEQNDKGNWDIITINENNKQYWMAEHLIVATGSHHIPNMLELNGFTGQKLHSSTYTGKDSFKNKKVLIIGVGESSSDIAADIATVAQQTVVWSRRPFLVAPRFPVEMIKDKEYDEHEIISAKEPRIKDLNDFLEFSTISRFSNMMSVLTYSLMRLLIFSIFRNVPIVSPTAKKIEFWTRLATKLSFWQQDQAFVVTKNSRLSTMSIQKKLSIIIAKSIQCLGNQVKFIDTEYNEATDTTLSFDVIIACTGYKTQFNWLNADIEYNARTWYKHCIPPNYGNKLMFLGWARPQQGGIPACAEMLARYAALLIKNERQLPENIGTIIKEDAEKERQFFKGSPHIHTLVDYLAYMDSIAKEIGCQPKIPNPITAFKLFIKYWIYPSWACWYRKDGVGKNETIFKEFLSDIPISIGGAMGLLIPQIILVTIGLPFYFIFWILKSLRLLSGQAFHFGWMWIKPKIYVLHSNG